MCRRIEFALTVVVINERNIGQYDQLKGFFS
jgi:hypothetical protein